MLQMLQRFYEILFDQRLDNIYVNEINENMLQIEYQYKDCYVENYFNTNTSFTNANA